MRTLLSSDLNAVPVLYARDAMKASLSQRFVRLVLPVLFVSLTYSTVATAVATAKTRPPVEAGDPEIGNEKPRGNPASSLRSADTAARTLRSEFDYWHRMLLAIRLARLGSVWW